MFIEKKIQIQALVTLKSFEDVGVTTIIKSFFADSKFELTERSIRKHFCR